MNLLLACFVASACQALQLRFERKGTRGCLVLLGAKRLPRGRGAEREGLPFVADEWQPLAEGEADSSSSAEAESSASQAAAEA